jgi:hypothetical protein
MHQLVLSSTLANLKHVSICELFAGNGFYYLAGLWQCTPNLEVLTLWRSCKVCLFHKVRISTHTHIYILFVSAFILYGC